MAKMIKCKSCGKEIAESAKTCPSCGAKNKKPIYKRVWFWIIIVLLVVAVASNGGSQDNASLSSTDTSSSQPSEPFSYTIDKSYLGDYDVGYYIEGSVTNNKSKDYSYVQIEFVCYDKEGNNLGTAFDNTNNLLGNQTWKYKAIFMGSNAKEVDHCDYHDITSW